MGDDRAGQWRTQVGEGFVGADSDVAHVNTILGRRGSPVEAAWATALATPRAGHVPFVVVLQPNLAVQPPTLFVNKAPLAGDRHEMLTWGAAQAGVATGVSAAVAEGVIAAADVTTLLLIAAVWVSPGASDESAVYANNHEATLAALRAGATDAPTVDAVLAARGAAEPVLPRLALSAPPNTFRGSPRPMSVAAADGRVGLPDSLRALAARDWDVVVVGAGHNGLTAAAYLAAAGCRVLVLERREQLGGACTVERPFTDPRFVMSPCAYLVGLLDPVVIEDFGLRRAGLRTFPVDPTSWTPFEDGTSLYQWRDADATASAVAALSPGDVDGFARYDALFDRIRDRLRRGPLGDTWDDPAPTPDMLADLFADDPDAAAVVRDASIGEVVERHVRDDRLRGALHGQGIIGTFAGPRDAGTAWVHAHHRLGLLGGWAFVEGGMGQISFLLADAARDAGASLAAGTPVEAIEPGVGVHLAGGERIRARAVVANADPPRVLRLLGDEAPASFAERVGAWRTTSPVVKVNCALARLPEFTAAQGDPRVHRAQVEIVGRIDETQAGCDAARRGELAVAWCELYFQSVHDPSVAPPGAHTMSVFAQYAPASAPDGPAWRERAGDAALAAIARFAPDVARCVVERQVLTPADVEERIGLTGGHIFQGEILPDQMWDRRFAARTPVPGLYLCGAATHPGGSVMARNGRNAAQVVLRDLGRTRVGARA